MIENAISTLKIFFGSYEAVLLYVKFFSCTIQIVLSFYLFKQIIQQKHHRALLFTLFLISSTLLFEHLSWLLVLTHRLNINVIPFYLIRFIVSLAWIGEIIRYQAFNLFITNVIRPTFSINTYNRFLLICNTVLASYVLYLSITHFENPLAFSEYPLTNYIPLFTNISLLPSIILLFKNLKTLPIPHILKGQTKILLATFIVPEFLINLIDIISMHLSIDYSPVHIISTLLILYGIFYSMRNILRFKFLNITVPYFNQPFIPDEKILRDHVHRFVTAETLNEIRLITQNFFKEAFGIQFQDTYLHIRHVPSQNAHGKKQEAIINAVIESFVAHDPKFANQVFYYNRINLVHEIEFDNFYALRPHAHLLHKTLQSLDAEMFMPIFYQDQLIAYICINKQKQEYMFTEKDKAYIFMFLDHLSMHIYFLLAKDITILQLENKKANDEIYFRHQEMNQYKEGLQTLYRSKPQQSVGSLFYRHGLCIAGSEAVKNILKVDVQKEPRHPFIQQIKEFAEKILKYKTAKEMVFINPAGQKVIVNGAPHPFHAGNVSLNVYYPDTSDIIKHQIDHLQDPTHWDYTLYLETTRSGKLVSQLLPSNQPEFLQFKISLLKASLTKKAVAIQAPKEDVDSIAEIIHTISLREQLHILDLQGKSTHEVALKLFGINPLLEEQQADPLLVQLDGQGTLFIKNIEYLDHEIQNKLAHLLKYGTFTALKSEKPLPCDVRILCSINKDLGTLHHDGRITQALYEELDQMRLALPSLLTLQPEHGKDLIDGLTQQMMIHAKEENLQYMQLLPQEKEFILQKQPKSISEFKQTIQQLLAQKIKYYKVTKETHFDESFDLSDPEIARAAQLGKDSLKDTELLTYLWKKFKNQNKIAMLLGVNRSSVNRRCKENNLIETETEN